MNVIKIVVDELPEMCEHCSYGATNKQGDNICVSDHNNIRPIDYFDDNRPDWCPLVVEECCEWKREKESYGEKPSPFWVSPHSKYFYTALRVDNKPPIFCRECGKRIKYVASVSSVEVE